LKYGSNPGCEAVALATARQLIKRRLTGSKHEKARHMERVEHIAYALHRRFHRGLRYVRLKELRWFLDKMIVTCPPEDWTNYYSTIRQIVFVLGKDQDWLPRLNGPWRKDGDLGAVERRPTPPLRKNTTTS